MSNTDNDILLIDDDPRHAKAFEEALIAAGDAPSNFEWVRTLSSGLERLAHKGVWAIFLNLFLPDSRGLHTIDKLLSFTSTAPIVVLGGVDGPGRRPWVIHSVTCSKSSTAPRISPHQIP